MTFVNYKTMVFDCDGVILNSNMVKTRAFYNAALPYGEQAAQCLVDYHVAHGGISRYKKFEKFLDEIIPLGAQGPNLDQLLLAYANEVRLGLLSCDVSQGLVNLRNQTRHANWLIVSGGDQEELREVFSERNLAELFDGGIFGSPNNKDEILSREKACGNIQPPSVFFGDSKYDYEASSRAGLDFVFVSEWSEFLCWESFFDNKNVKVLKNLGGVF